MDLLTAQGLDAADLEANRAGRVTETQLARQFSVRRGGARGAWLMVAVVLIGCGLGAVSFWQQGLSGGALFMGVLALAGCALPLGIFYAFRFVDPQKLKTCTVLRLEKAEVGVFLPSPTRGVYAISLNHERYSGFATALTRAHFGTHVNAYVVKEHRIVLALEAA